MDPDRFEGASWIWGLPLIALTLAIHSAGVVVLTYAGGRIRRRLAGRTLSAYQGIPLLTGIIGFVGLVLALLHGLEAMFWAGAYVRLGALGSLAEAWLYSLGSLTTRGTPGLQLPYRWQMMGALEAVNGMLLFGISTAFIFAVMQAYWPLLSHRHDRSAAGQS